MAQTKDQDLERTAILLAPSGSRGRRAEASFTRVERAVRDRWPGASVFWALGSRAVRRLLAKAGQDAPSPTHMLSHIREQGFKRVAVLPLQVLAGTAYHEVHSQAGAFQAMRGGFEDVAVAPPLLNSPDDFARATAALLAETPDQRKEDQAVIWVGHGTVHPAGAAYLGLAFLLERRDPLITVGCLDHQLPPDEVIDRLKALGVAKVWLMPLFTMLGRHVERDLAGEEPHSWLSKCRAAGLEAQAVMRPLVDSPGLLDIWLDGLAGALKE
jgi:sirohydrochlorin cobaltochelatase